MPATPRFPLKSPAPSVGLLGFGAFGRLLAGYLAGHFALVINDPALAAGDPLSLPGARAGTAAEAATCDLVILAVPLAALRATARRIAPHLRPGSIVLDVTSVKVAPAAIMLAELPAFVDIVGTHPLFGPQSARNGLRGHKIAVCPVRGRSAPRIAAFLRRGLGLQVCFTTPEEHDREAAVVQGLTHMVAHVLVQMEPLPRRLTTASFERLMEAVEMVRYDAPGVFLAIEGANPFAAEVRERFLTLAAETAHRLNSTAVADPGRKKEAAA